MNGKIDKNNKGFTLVELIVVLVILAILAAILVPALLGYIKSAKEKEHMLNAKSCLNAIQAELTKCYATQSDKLSESNNNIFGDNKIKDEGNNVDVTKTDFAQNVIDLIDNNPYCVMFATGYYGLPNNKKKYESSLHEAYTVFYIYYQEEEDSAPLYYVNGEWTKQNPRYGSNNKPTNIMDKKDGLNIMKVGTLNGKAFRYYMVINNTKYKKNGYTDFGQLWAKVLELHDDI